MFNKLKIQLFLFLALTVLLISAAACADVKGAIIGRWQLSEGGGPVLEFFKGDTVTLSNNGITTAGTYKWLDDKTIQITVPGLFGNSSQVFDVVVSGEKLSLSTGGSTINFNKVKK